MHTQGFCCGRRRGHLPSMLRTNLTGPVKEPLTDDKEQTTLTAFRQQTAWPLGLGGMVKISKSVSDIEEFSTAEMYPGGSCRQAFQPVVTGRTRQQILWPTHQIHQRHEGGPWNCRGDSGYQSHFYSSLPLGQSNVGSSIKMTLYTFWVHHNSVLKNIIIQMY